MKSFRYKIILCLAIIISPLLIIVIIISALFNIESHIIVDNTPGAHSYSYQKISQIGTRVDFYEPPEIYFKVHSLLIRLYGTKTENMSVDSGAIKAFLHFRASLSEVDESALDLDHCNIFTIGSHYRISFWRRIDNDIIIDDIGNKL